MIWHTESKWASTRIKVKFSIDMIFYPWIHLLFFHYHYVYVYKFVFMCVCSSRARTGKDPSKRSLFTRCVSLPQRPVKTRQQSAPVTAQDLRSKGEERYLSCCDISYEKVLILWSIIFQILMMNKVKLCLLICYLFSNCLNSILSFSILFHFNILYLFSSYFIS